MLSCRGERTCGTRAERKDEIKTTIGTIQVYTGNGKGKTTASLGLAMRALGHGQNVCMIQFMKGSTKYGEIRFAKKTPGLTVIQSGRRCFVGRDNPDPKDIRMAERGLAKARETVLGGKYDLVILDEVNVALDYKLINIDDVLAILKKKPKKVELVLTGRAAPKEIIDLADLVSEVKEIKHHWRKGVKARPGVEF